MYELIVVFVIVGIAGFYVGRRLLRQLKGRGCEDCDHSQRAKCNETLIQLKPFDKNKL